MDQRDLSRDLIIIVGSGSDLEKLREWGIDKMIDEMGIVYEISVFSAHRHPEELAQYVRAAAEDGLLHVFIGVAGMSAALPGVIASHTRGMCPVIGVPFGSKEHPLADDALFSMLQMPTPLPVAVAGTLESGMRKAVILAAQILLTRGVAPGFEQWMKSELAKKEPQRGVNLAVGP